MQSSKLFVIFCAVISIIFILQSCSNENLVTTPPQPKSNVNAMNKTSAMKIVSSINTDDTVITLPLSKKTIEFKKGTPSDKIALLDKYLSTHKNLPTKRQTVSPNALTCGQYDEYDWEYENQYQAVPGKNLGIWTNDITVWQTYNQYGFTSLFVTSTTDIDSGYADGFSEDNMMWGLGLPDYAGGITNSTSGGRHVGSYYIDEPIETGKGGGGWTPTLVLDAASLTPKPVMLGSYKWPVVPQYYDVLTNTTYGQIYGPLINSANNLYIMCDEYHGNCLGTVEDYWGEFHDYYTSPKNPTDWLNVVDNNGTGGGHNTCNSENSTSWYDLIHFADGSLGMNTIWLYAENTGDEQAIASFCYAAWYEGWLLRQQKQILTVWKCSTSPCTSCSYPNSGAWYILESYYTEVSRYVPY